MNQTTNIIFHAPESFDCNDFISLVFGANAIDLEEKDVCSLEEQILNASLKGYRLVNLKNDSPKMFKPMEYLLIPYRVHNDNWSLIPYLILKASKPELTLFSKIGLTHESVRFYNGNYRPQEEHEDVQNPSERIYSWTDFIKKVNKKLSSDAFSKRFPSCILERLMTQHTIAFDSKTSYSSTKQKFYLPSSYDLNDYAKYPIDRELFCSIKSRTQISEDKDNPKMSKKYFIYDGIYATDSEQYVDGYGNFHGNIEKSYLRSLTIAPTFKLCLVNFF